MLRLPGATRCAVTVMVTAVSIFTYVRMDGGANQRLKWDGLYDSSQNVTETTRRPAPGTIFLYPERIRLREGGLAEAERGMIFVPLNRSDAKGPVIGVEFYRFRARAGSSANAAPIFRLHGGPGFRGLADRLVEPGYYEDNIWPAVR